jgi:hypothetical protein
VPNVPFPRADGFVASAFWLVPWAVVSAADELSLSAVLVSGLAAGGAWQVVRRRDLVERFGVLSLLLAVLTVAAAVAPGDLGFDARGAVAGLQVAVGTVAAEYLLRLRDQRRSRDEPRATGTVPTGP